MISAVVLCGCTPAVGYSATEPDAGTPSVPAYTVDRDRMCLSLGGYLWYAVETGTVLTPGEECFVDGDGTVLVTNPSFPGEPWAALGWRRCVESEWGVFDMDYCE